MPNELFEVPSPFDEADAIEAEVADFDTELDAKSVEINTRRAQAENAENLRLARAL